MSGLADTIVTAKAIHSVSDRGRVDALAIRDGLIIAIGDKDDMLACRGSETELVDLGDACVTPGLIEPHTHPDLCAQMYSWVDVSGYTRPSVALVERQLIDARESTPFGQWIFAFGLDPMLTKDLGVWGRDRLDAMFPQHPVAVMIQSMHTLFVNSMAMLIAGINDDSPDPGGGGVYQRDSTGRLTGLMRESAAISPFTRFLNRQSDDIRHNLESQYNMYRDAGITSLGIAGIYAAGDESRILREVATRASVRTTAYVRINQIGDLDASNRDDGRFRIAGVKLWYDGSPYTGTMLLDEPYLDSDLCCCTLGIEPGTLGHANFERDDMVDVLADLASKGWQVLTHAQGDRGCREMLDLYEQVLRASGRLDHRWRLEHCALISQADLRRSAVIGVSPSFHINHVRYYGPELRDEIIGSQRAENLMPLASALECGHRISLHADSPMYPPGPLSLMRTAVTRLARTDEVIAGHQAISVMDALKAVSINAAWQLGMDQEVGSLEVGKRADLTVLGEDPFSVPPRDIDRIDVLGTWLDGRPT